MGENTNKNRELKALVVFSQEILFQFNRTNNGNEQMTSKQQTDSKISCNNCGNNR